MRQAVIVSYARTGLAKASRGGFNATTHTAMLGHAIQHAVARAKVDAQEVEDVVAGCVAASGNVARGAALFALLGSGTSRLFVVDLQLRLPVHREGPDNHEKANRQSAYR